MLLALITVGLVLAAIFSAAVAAYLVQYTFCLRRLATRLVAGVIVGAATFTLTAALGIMVVWPPYLPL